MAKQNITTLKGYFETGDIPNQSQYGDLIDSNLNLSETGTQIITGTISASKLDASTYISSSGNIQAVGYVSASAISSSGDISAGGKIAGLSGSFSHISSTSSIITVRDQTTFQSSVTASIISASGHISCSGLIVGGSEINLLGGNITASGTITATGGIIGAVTTTGITSTGTGTFTTINTGQGATEVHLMDQNVRTTDAVVFTTVNTGQGANELYDMNQNVTTTSAVTFDSVTLSKTTATSVTYEEGTPLTFNTFNSTIQIAGIPAISGIGDTGVESKSVEFSVNNSSCKVNSIVLASVQDAELTVRAYKISNGAFNFKISNLSTSEFSGTAILNFVIL